MKIKLFQNGLIAILISILVITCGKEKKEVEIKEKAAIKTTKETEWITLFDGKTFNNWKQYGTDEIGNGWTIENGMIIASKEGVDGNNIGFGASIITIDEFGDFEFEMEYKLTPTGNTGIMYHVKEDTIYSQDYETGTEFQLLDDAGSTIETLPSHQTASNYDMYAPKADKKLNGPNEWNKVKLVYNNKHVEHWLNGEKVLEYEEGSEEYNGRYAKSKWNDFPGWGKFQKGHIGLQNHGDAVWFKNIRIKRLNMDKVN